MIELLFRLGLAAACGIAAMAAAFYLLAIVPVWLRERKLAKTAAEMREQKQQARFGRRRAIAEAGKR